MDVQQQPVAAQTATSSAAEEPLTSAMLDKMQSLEDKIENKLKEIDKMFAVGSDLPNPTPTVGTASGNLPAPGSSPLVNSALT